MLISRRTAILGLPLGVTACMDGAPATGSSGTTTPWPSFQPTLQEGRSTSANLATLPDRVRITPPAQGVPPVLRQAVGRWEGWIGQNAAFSVALAVEEVTADGGVGTYAFASNTQASRSWDWRFRLVNGNELSGVVTGGVARITVRPRPDGAMDILWQAPPDSWSAGVLSRRTPAFAARSA
jgi:hypothetical protein